MDFKTTKGFKTNKILKQEAVDFLNQLQVETNGFIKQTFPFLVKLWPIKAQRKGLGQKQPVFIVNHHTSGTKTSPAVNRYCAADMASAHFLIERNGNIIMFVHPDDMSFHATQRNINPLLTVDFKRLFKIETGWINEVGIEHVGNGNDFLFTYDQFVASIVLQRYIRAYFDNAITKLFSHRFFSPIARAGDPGPFFMLPLVEHAVLNDVDLTDSKYWVQHVKDNPIDATNSFKTWMQVLNIDLSKDEWGGKRGTASQKNIL